MQWRILSSVSVSCEQTGHRTREDPAKDPDHRRVAVSWQELVSDIDGNGKRIHHLRRRRPDLTQLHQDGIVFESRGRRVHPGRDPNPWPPELPTAIRKQRDRGHSFAFNSGKSKTRMGQQPRYFFGRVSSEGGLRPRPNTGKCSANPPPHSSTTRRCLPRPKSNTEACKNTLPQEYQHPEVIV